jgi:hypothetical protein
VGLAGLVDPADRDPVELAIRFRPGLILGG